jgi:hypothetical protein
MCSGPGCPPHLAVAFKWAALHEAEWMTCRHPIPRVVLAGRIAASKEPMHPVVTVVEAIPPEGLLLRFTDDSIGDIDLRARLHQRNNRLFAEFREPAPCARV